MYERPYAIPIARQQAVAGEIERMLKMDIVERSRSPYSIPIIPVLKKTTVRYDCAVCIDARKLNSQIIIDRNGPTYEIFESTIHQCD